MKNADRISEEMTTLLTIIRHREYLADCLEELADAMRARGRLHDRSKLEGDQFDGFVKINATARNHKYGSEEYKKSLRDVNAVRIHQTRESHHPEYWATTPAAMGFLDIIEMVFDWYAASKTYGQSSFRESLEIQRKRFKQFSPGQWWLIDQIGEWIETMIDRKDFTG